jgi:hypothetical protein
MHDMRLAVALPVKDETERLPACLTALCSQDLAVPMTILALVNNSTDSSAAIARHFTVSDHCNLLVKEVTCKIACKSDPTPKVAQCLVRLGKSGFKTVAFASTRDPIRQLNSQA